MFELLKEYSAMDLEFAKKYNHPIVRWYQRKHMADIFGEPFNEDKPAKTFRQSVESIPGKVNRAIEGAKLDETMRSVGDRTYELGQKVERGGAELIDKFKKSQWGSSLIQKFKKKEADPFQPNAGTNAGEAEEQETGKKGED